MKILVDTSVLVAAFVDAHPAHDRARTCIKQGLAGKVQLRLATHTLAELYAVLTTMPVSPRISPASAWRLIQSNTASMKFVALDEEDYRETLRGLGELELSGGVVYDGLIARAAQKAKADRLVTLNRKHFERVRPLGVEKIESP